MTRNRERGMVLGIAMLAALIATIASYAMLAVAVSRARQARFYRDRLPARYAAEAAVVRAQQRLWTTPGYCGELGLVIGGVTVDVTVSDCTPGNPKTVSAKAIY